MTAWLPNGDWPTIFQLVLDGLLVVLVLVLLLDRRRKLFAAQSRQVVESFERILAETQTLSEGFERNLRERGRLIEKVLESLDTKIEEARAVLKRLEHCSQVTPGTIPAIPRDSSSKSLVEKILQLADAGHSPQDIATRMRRPIGEVELVLSLHKLQKKSE